MAKDKVIFLYNTHEEEVFAVFLNTRRRDAQSNIIYYDGYAHIGQHTEVSLEYTYNDTIIEADPNQFSELLSEIIQIGYNPEVIQIKSKLC